jgi:mono/diheme cytochrome c family protein
MRILKRVLKAIGFGVLLVVVALGIFVYICCSQFDASLQKIYDVPVVALSASTDAAVIARGDHLVHSIAGCASNLCHGADLGGGKPIDMGPVATLYGPNITPGGLGAAYSDGELARLIKHGIKKDGRSIRFMPVQDINWLPEGDVLAVVSYLRTIPPVDRPNEASVVRTLGKVLDRQERFAVDVARHIDHGKVEQVPAPAPTAAYGAMLARSCSGCHGERMSGGPIPGAPSSFATPLNLTPDDTGLKGWEFSDFDKVLRVGLRKNGKMLDSLMPIEAWKNLDDTEMHALWAYLRSLPPTPFGQR